MKFEDMGFDGRILRALAELGFEQPTEIQEKSVPHVMQGKDIIGQSMTGSGKTLAFGCPILQKIVHGRGIQALIITPTRELADQVAGHMKKYAKHMTAEICEVFGGVSLEPQVVALRRADIVVGTPGRILDHMSRRTIDLRNVKFLVLDEADRMLDMGFIDDIRRIMSVLPDKKQTMLFSATMPPEIEYLARRFMHHPVKVKTQSLVSKQKMRQYYCDVKPHDKLSLLVHLIRKEKPHLAIVFCNTKRMTDFVGRVLAENGVEAKSIHGDMSQAARMHALESFHRGTIHVLAATDVAARGLDIKDVTHIFNYDLPGDAENYTHRIGRTARIGKEGKVISLLAPEDHEAFRRIIRTHEVGKVVETSFPHIQVRMHHEARRGHYGGRSRGGRRRY